MINKYQQGGAAPQQGGSILAQIQQLPQEQQQQLMLAFAQWAQQKGVDIQQLQSNPQVLELALGLFMQEMQAQQAQAAKHGAKLQYIKKLKHQCSEDEELQFFKAGGLMGCKCVKKEQNGGKQEPNKNAIQQFKDKKKVTPVKRTKAEQDSINKLSEEDYFKGTADHTKPGTKKIQLKKKECGGKMKKHLIGGTLETLRQSLGLEKKKFITKALRGNKLNPTTERTDNTRVLHIPNSGEAIYERTPVGYGDFLPLVGTYRAAQRIDNGEPNASYGDLIVNGAMDLLGAGMIGSVVKAAGKANRIHKALKASGFRQVGPEPTKFIKTANRTKLSRGYMNPDKYYHINLGPEVVAEKTVPNVDYTNVVMQPIIQSLRVPATAPFK